MSQIQVPKGWELKKLSDVCKKITSGGTPSRNNSSFFGGNIPWLKIGDLNEGIVIDSEEKITSEGLKNSSAKVFPKNTVLLAMYGATIGKTGILGRDCATNQAICGMICDEVLNPNYLLYFLKSQYREIRKKAEGGAQPNINQDKIKNLQIPIPSLRTQEKIVQKLDNILGQLREKKKEIIQRINKFDAEKIRIVYQNHLLNLAFSGRLINRQITYTKYGEIQIPEDWKLEDLNRLVSGIEKRDPTKNPNYEFKYVEIASIDNINKKIISYKTLQGKYAPSRARNLIKTDDVIYATTRPYYRDVAMIDSELDNQICSTGFCVLRIINRKILNPRYLFYFLLSDLANIQILGEMRGSNYPAVRNENVTNIKIPIPFDEDTQKKIVQRLDVGFKEWEKYSRQIERIEKQYHNTRKSLESISSSILNAAFSGKLVN